MCFYYSDVRDAILSYLHSYLTQGVKSYCMLKFQSLKPTLTFSSLHSKIFNLPTFKLYFLKLSDNIYILKCITQTQFVSGHYVSISGGSCQFMTASLVSNREKIKVWSSCKVKLFKSSHQCTVINPYQNLETACHSFTRLQFKSRCQYYLIECKRFIVIIMNSLDHGPIIFRRSLLFL